MTRLNRAQRVALKRVFDRGPMYLPGDDDKRVPLAQLPTYEGQRSATYREFRQTVLIGAVCAMVKWSGMWLGIEPDGYTHS